MRTTFSMVNRNVQQNLNTRFTNLAKLQEQLATGKRLSKPSDDPVDVANALKLRTKHTQLAQYKRNLEDGMALMGVASSAMQSMNELLHRMRELAVQGANDTNMLSDRQYMQQEVDQLMRQMMSVINTQYKGDYIFNGTQTKIPPYEMKTSKANLMDYMNNTMATYGGPDKDTSYIKEASAERTNDRLYLDFDPLPVMKIGDRIQMKWETDDEAQGYIIPDTLPLNTFDVIDVNGATQTFNKDPGLVPGDPGYIAPGEPGYVEPDYKVDYRTGEIIVLSERLRDTLNGIQAKDVNGVPTVIMGDSNADNFRFSMTGTVQIIDVRYENTTTDVKNILPGSLKISIGDKTYFEGFGEYQPGYYDEEGVYHEGKNEYDFSVDYITGQITIYNMELMHDMRSETRGGPGDPNGAWAHLVGIPNQYYSGGFSLTFEYIDRGVNIFGDKVASHGEIYRAIEEGITAQINIGAADLLTDKWTGLNMVDVMLRYSQAIYGGDRDGIQTAISDLTAMYDTVLNSQSQMGARIYRFELTQSRNSEQNLEVGIQRSALEDADMAETITNLTLAQNVYQAALQSSMRVMQLSLANYM